MSNNYEFVNVRFNLDKEDEKALYSKLNPSNKGGSVKKFLKKFFALDDENLMKKAELKSIIKELVDDEMGIREEKKIIPSVNQKKKIRIITEGRE